MPPLRTVAAICRSFDIDEKDLVDLIRAGKVRGYRVAGRLAVDIEELGEARPELRDPVGARPVPRQRWRKVSAELRMDVYDAVTAATRAAGHSSRAV